MQARERAGQVHALIICNIVHDITTMISHIYNGSHI